MMGKVKTQHVPSANRRNAPTLDVRYALHPQHECRCIHHPSVNIGAKDLRGRQVQTSSAVVARGVAVAVKVAATAKIAEFNSDGPYPLLNALGATTEFIAFAKSVVHVECAPRAEIENNAVTFWASFGYEPIVETLLI